MTGALLPRRMTIGKKTIVSLIVYLVCLAPALAEPPASEESDESAWSWEFVGTYTPRFKEKSKEDNSGMLVVEVSFHNNRQTDDKLVVAQESFVATRRNGEAIEIAGLLIHYGYLEGAKRMAYTGGNKPMHMFTVGQEEEVNVILNAGPVEVTIGAGQRYKQRLLLTRPDGKEPLWLTFDKLPELQVLLPQ